MADKDKAREVSKRIEKYLQDRLKSIAIDPSELAEFLTPVMPEPSKATGDNSGLLESLAAIKSGTSQKHIIHNMLTEIGKRCRGCGLILLRTKNPVFWSGPGMGQRLGEPAGTTKIEVEIAPDSLVQQAVNKMSAVTSKYPGSATEQGIYQKLGISPPAVFAIIPMAVSGNIQAAVLADSETEPIDELASIAIIVAMSGTFIEQLSFRKWVGYSPMPNIGISKDAARTGEPAMSPPAQMQPPEIEADEQPAEPVIEPEVQMPQLEMPEELEIEELPELETAEEGIPEIEPFYQAEEETPSVATEESEEAAGPVEFEFETSDEPVEEFETEMPSASADPFDEAFPEVLGEDESGLPDLDKEETEFEFELAGSVEEDTSETEAFPMTDLPSFEETVPETEESPSFEIDVTKEEEPPSYEISAETEIAEEESTETPGEITAETEPMEQEFVAVEDEGPDIVVDSESQVEEEPALEESAGIEIEEAPPEEEAVEEKAEKITEEKMPFDEFDQLGYDIEKYDKETKKLHEKAIRFARLLISEIKLYNEDAVMQGRENHDLATRLKDDITRSRTLYDQRITEEVRSQFDYFKEELIRQLADGDRSQFE